MSGAILPRAGLWCVLAAGKAGLGPAAALSGCQGCALRESICCTWSRTSTASQLSTLIMLPSEAFLGIQGEAAQAFFLFQGWEILPYLRLKPHLTLTGL